MTLPKADVVLKRGTIWCAFPEATAEAMALWQDPRPGPLCEIEPLIDLACRVIDLKSWRY